MPRVIHPQYERFVDRKTGVTFEPTVVEGRLLACAEVSDPAPYLGRGFALHPEDAKPKLKPKAKKADE